MIKTLKLFPRDKTFWFYHLSALFIALAINMVSYYIYGRLDAKNIVEALAWIPPYSLAALGFRWLYTKLNWKALSMGKLIPLVIVYGTASGLFVAITVVALVTPIFWSDIVNDHLASNAQFSPGMYFFRVIVGGALQSQLFICAWAFIYISVTSSRHIKETEVINLRLQNSLKEAQLSSLSNQLNPHFLFNSLNNIRFMIHENTQHADSMIIALSEILRYSLESSKREKVSLSEELAIIERYISIVKIQMEERLQFSMNIPKHLTNCQIPPMVLQMLVENAIKHGLDQLHQGGQLHVSCIEKDQELIFTVRNDLPVTHKKVQDGMGIGLQNIRQRLHLLYGHKGTLTIGQDMTQFTVTISIPKEIAA